ncbi:histidine phosphatase superfamily [Pavlovales sp. CCMP2436]|nr:histidine phosphatase superfamily [Pavlovales sp. CCMP2436]
MAPFLWRTFWGFAFICALSGPAAGADEAACAPFTLTALPPDWACAKSKTLYLIRHAEGTHNEAESAEEARPTHRGAATGARYRDPPLTATGSRQAERLFDEMDARSLHIELVTTSPMRRTLQTAHIGIPHLRGAATTPAVATDLLRERVGPYTCDQRVEKSSLASEFAGVDFSEVDEQDWMTSTAQEYGPNEGALLAERAERAVEWLLGRPEQHIAVVSHQHFLRALTKLSVDSPAGGLSFRNAEIQTFHLCERTQQPAATLPGRGPSNRERVGRPHAVQVAALKGGDGVGAHRHIDRE